MKTLTKLLFSAFLLAAAILTSPLAVAEIRCMHGGYCGPGGGTDDPGCMNACYTLCAEPPNGSVLQCECACLSQYCGIEDCL